MNAALLYFSGTDNTAWAVEVLKSELRSQDIAVDIFDLEEDRPFDHHIYDTFILAHPVYGANIPRFVLERTLMLIPGNIHLQVVTTFGYVNALGYFAEKKILGRKVDAYYNIRMFNNITTPRSKIKIKALHKRLKAKDRLEEKIRRIARLISEGKHRIQGVGPHLLGGIFVRRALRPGIRDHYRSLGVDADRCTLCGKCIRECPTNSIEEHHGSFTFHATCTACMRCYNHCPEYAITINGVYANPRIYPRYRGPWNMSPKV